MADLKYSTPAALFKAICDALRAKLGIVGSINHQDIPEKIAAISTGTDTSDATATAADIHKGKTAYIAAGKTEGTMAEMSGSTVTPASFPHTFSTANKYLTGNCVVNAPADLSAGNIRSGVTIAGVQGTYSGEGAKPLSFSLDVTSTQGARISAAYTGSVKPNNIVVFATNGTTGLLGGNKDYAVYSLSVINGNGRIWCGTNDADLYYMEAADNLIQQSKPAVTWSIASGKLTVSLWGIKGGYVYNPVWGTGIAGDNETPSPVFMSGLTYMGFAW